MKLILGLSLLTVILINCFACYSMAANEKESGENSVVYFFKDFFVSFFEPSTKNLMGKKAPSFVLKDIFDKDIQLFQNEAVNRTVIVFFATWCSDCQVEMKNLVRIHDEYASKGIRIIAVDLGEEKERVIGFANEHRLAFPVLLDSKNEIKTLYHVRGLPTVYILNKDGIVTHIQIGSATEAMLKEKLAVRLEGVE